MPEARGSEPRPSPEPDELIDRHVAALRAFVRLRLGPEMRALESESDLVQSVCGDLIAELDRIELRTDAELRSWLFTAALNKIRNKHRYHTAAKRRPPAGDVLALDDAVLAEAFATATSPTGRLLRREQAELLERAMDRLPEDYRAVLTLAKLGGLSQEETARAMGRTVPAVRNLLNRAMVKLAAALSVVDRGGGSGGDQ